MIQFKLAELSNFQSDGKFMLVRLYSKVESGESSHWLTSTYIASTHATSDREREIPSLFAHFKLANTERQSSHRTQHHHLKLCHSRQSIWMTRDSTLNRFFYQLCCSLQRVLEKNWLGKRSTLVEGVRFAALLRRVQDRKSVIPHKWTKKNVILHSK